MADEPASPPGELSEREERVQEAAARIAEEDRVDTPPVEGDEVDIAAEAARAGLEQAHRSALTHP